MLLFWLVVDVVMDSMIVLVGGIVVVRFDLGVSVVIVVVVLVRVIVLVLLK